MIKLVEDLREHLHKRYTFNIECLPTDDYETGKISLYEIPDNVREQLAKEIINYPSNRFVIWDDEFEDVNKQEEEDDETY